VVRLLGGDRLGLYGLAIIGVLSSVVSVFFSLRIVVMMYMTDRDARPVPAPISGLAMGGLVVAMLGVLYPASCRRA
jgi:NADH-quinone oxidoreductase subunit N